MGVAVEELSARFPRLYHMAAEGSWVGIERHGLLSTSALLDLFEIQGEQREQIESRHRSECITIRHPQHGSAVIRDQKPMDDAGLRRALTGGLTPFDWYRILNRKVFFWLTCERLKRILDARAYRGRRQTVIVLDTHLVVERYGIDIVLSPLNSGCTRPFAHKRGASTFLALSEYPFTERLHRGLEPVVELAIERGMHDVKEMLLKVEEIGGGVPTTVLIMKQSR
jgi:hypothetical protein